MHFGLVGVAGVTGGGIMQIIAPFLEEAGENSQDLITLEPILANMLKSSGLSHEYNPGTEGFDVIPSYQFEQSLIDYAQRTEFTEAEIREALEISLQVMNGIEPEKSFDEVPAAKLFLQVVQSDISDIPPTGFKLYTDWVRNTLDPEAHQFLNNIERMYRSLRAFVLSSQISALTNSEADEYNSKDIELPDDLDEFKLQALRFFYSQNRILIIHNKGASPEPQIQQEEITARNELLRNLVNARLGTSLTEDFTRADLIDALGFADEQIGVQIAEGAQDNFISSIEKQRAALYLYAELSGIRPEVIDEFIRQGYFVMSVEQYAIQVQGREPNPHIGGQFHTVGRMVTTIDADPDTPELESPKQILDHELSHYYSKIFLQTTTKQYTLVDPDHGADISETITLRDEFFSRALDWAEREEIPPEYEMFAFVIKSVLYGNLSTEYATSYRNLLSFTSGSWDEYDSSKPFPCPGDTTLLRAQLPNGLVVNPAEELYAELAEAILDNRLSLENIPTEMHVYFQGFIDFEALGNLQDNQPEISLGEVLVVLSALVSGLGAHVYLKKD